MAGSVNRVILVGNLGKDPEVRNAAGGGRIVTFTLATSESWTDKASGEKREKVEWHRVVVFNERIGEAIERFVSKGRKVFVEGKLQTRKWTDQSGVEKFTTEVVVDRFDGNVVFLDSGQRDGVGGGDGYGRGSSSGSSSGDRGGRSQQRAGVPGNLDRPAAGYDPLDDEIPF